MEEKKTIKEHSSTPKAKLQEQFNFKSKIARFQSLETIPPHNQEMKKLEDFTKTSAQILGAKKKEQPKHGQFDFHKKSENNIKLVENSTLYLVAEKTKGRKRK